MLRSLKTAAAFGIGLLLAGGAAAAANRAGPVDERVLLNAPHVVVDPKTHHADLTLTYVSAKIYNPASGRNERVVLRTFLAQTQAVDRAPAGIRDATPKPYIAPTLEVTPGETLRITLHNALNVQPGCKDGIKNINVPHCFNTTNLHMHGLWVDPKAPGDDVLLSVAPGGTYNYIYNIRDDHPAGTLWYHPHMHGTTALQVGGGAAGALIVRGIRKPTMARTGEIDTLLTQNLVKERVLVMQQIQYACFNGAPDEIVDEDKTDYYASIKAYPNKTWRCDPTDPGQIKGYAQIGFDPSTGLEKWSVSGRFTMINGETLPVFEGATVGKLERWRIVDAGLANTISIEIRELAARAPSPDKLDSYANALWVAKYCTGTLVHQYAIANDGLTRAAVVDRGADKPSVFQPGYRQDILLAYPHEGHYCVIDRAGVGLATSETAVVQRAQLLGIVHVGKGEKPFVDQTKFVRERLVAAAHAAGYDKATTDAVIADLNDRSGMLLSRFVQHESLEDVAVDGHQEVAFNIGADPDPTHTSSSNPSFMIGQHIGMPEDDRPYDKNQWRVLYLGDVDEWKLTSRVGGHPFHIHVNPFQIISIRNNKNPTVELSVTGEPDRDPAKSDMQYADLQGTWKDTIFVKPDYTIVIRTKYREFFGPFVLHCHILDHEDQGMMENIVILHHGDKLPYIYPGADMKM